MIRLRSIHSSKHAPSVDIASAFSHLHAIRHLVSGGYVLVDEEGNKIAPRQAGPEVLALLEDDEFLRFMSMEGLTERSKSGEFFLASIQFADMKIMITQVSTCPWWGFRHVHGAIQ